MPNTINSGNTGNIPYYAATGTDLSPSPGITYDAVNRVLNIGAINVTRSSFSGGFGYAGMSYQQFHTSAAISSMNFVRGRGTSSSKVKPNNADQLANIVAAGWNGTAPMVGSYIRAVVNGTTSATSMPTEWVFGTHDGTTLEDRVKITKDGVLQANTIAPLSTTDLTLNAIGQIVLGAASKVKITGGSAGQSLTTDGNGNLSWTTVGGSSNQLVNGEYEVVLGSDGALTLPSGAGFGLGESGQLKVNDQASQSLDFRDSAGRGFYTNSDGYTLRSNGNYSWTFTFDGHLALPNGAVVRDTAGLAVAIGASAGNTSQGTQAIAIGLNAGANTQGENAVAVGGNAGNDTQGIAAVAVGVGAGQTSQGTAAVAIGGNAGTTTQGIAAVAVGQNAGTTTQGGAAVAVGVYAGNTSQGENAVAIGVYAGNTSQDENAVAIGGEAGKTTQGVSAIAIGYRAGPTSQAANSIVINATGVALDNTTESSLVVKPVRGVAGASLPAGFKPVAYNPTTGEFIYYDL